MLIRESRDQHSFVNSPGLIADFHALHRLLTPRHPPYALSSLTTYIQNSPLTSPSHLETHLLRSSGCDRYQQRSLSELARQTVILTTAWRPSRSHTKLWSLVRTNLLANPAESPSSRTEDAYYRYNQIVKDHPGDLSAASLRPNGQKPHSYAFELPSSPSPTRSGKRLASTSLQRRNTKSNDRPFRCQCGQLGSRKEFSASPRLAPRPANAAASCERRILCHAWTDENPPRRVSSSQLPMCLRAAGSTA